MVIIKNTVQVATLIVMTALFFSPATASAQFFYMENEDIGREVPDFTLKVLSGEEVNLTAFREGKKAIIFFWATWCPHCRVALGELNKQREEIEENNVKIVLVDIGEKEPIVSAYMEKNDISMEVFLDEDSKVAETYGLIGVPTFYFIDEDGTIKDVKHSLPKSGDGALALEQIFSKS